MSKDQKLQRILTKNRWWLRLSKPPFAKLIIKLPNHQIIKSISIHITGTVQGVFFRKYTKEKAVELGLTGFVKNEPDETVLIHATGNTEQLDQLIAWCHEGSPRSRVDKVEVSDLPLEEFSSFEIKRSY